MSDDDGCSDMALLILTGGLWFIVMFLRAYANRNKPTKSGEKLRCDLCSYRWVHQYESREEQVVLGFQAIKPSISPCCYITKRL